MFLVVCFGTREHLQLWRAEINTAALESIAAKVGPKSRYLVDPQLGRNRTARMSDCNARCITAHKIVNWCFMAAGYPINLSSTFSRATERRTACPSFTISQEYLPVKYNGPVSYNRTSIVAAINEKLMTFNCRKGP